MQDNKLTAITDLPIPNLLRPGFLQAGKPLALANAPLLGTQAYYRSKALNSLSGINPLCGAAAPLLNFIVQFQATFAYGKSDQIYQDLLHEMRAFETQAQRQGYRSETILLARYILCAVLDETILTSAWGENSGWHKYKLLSVLHSEDWGGERCFVILERLSADPAIHIDVLELIYLCLNLGYAGKYRLADSTQVEYHLIVENLYQCIQAQRGEVCKELAINEQPVQNLMLVNPAASASWSFWPLSLLTLLLLCSLYAGFEFMLENSVTPLYTQLSSIAQNYVDL